MKVRTVDVAIVGAGSAGLVAFRSARKWTDNVVLIEGGLHGTTCARVGCMPSKLLIAAAESAQAARQGPEFGIKTGKLEIDGEAVMHRVRSERDRFVGYVLEDIHEIPEQQRIKGYAQFIDDHQLQIDNHTIVKADRIVVASGSSPSYPAAWRSLGDRLVVNDDVFDWDTLPDSIAVFGPGVIGLELGQALHHLGVEVFMFGHGDRIGPFTDPKLTQYAIDHFSGEFYLDINADVRRVERIGESVEIDYVDLNAENQTIKVDYLLAATGRRPNLSKLSLANTTLPLDEKGIPIYDKKTMQIGDSHVFIAGDASPDRALLHEAADEGYIAGNNAGNFPNIEEGLRRSPLAIVFSDPQIAMVGATFSDLDGNDTVIGEASFRNQGRSRIMLKNYGLIRLYADASKGLFLGAEIFGPRAEHLGHLLAWSHQSGHSVDDMLEMPFYHPVIEEGLRTALRDASRKLVQRRKQAA